MKRQFFYMLMLTLTVISRLNAQDITAVKPNHSPISKPVAAVYKAPCFVPAFHAGNGVQVQLVQSNLYTKDLGFFCRQELKIEQQTRVPLRLRLGNMEYCNWMEQKAGSIMPGK